MHKVTLLWCEGLVTFTSLRFFLKMTDSLHFLHETHICQVLRAPVYGRFWVLWGAKLHRMDLDANCSTLGANGALAEIVAKHVPEAYIDPTAHAVPPNLSQISWILLLVVVQPKAKCLSVSLRPNSSSPHHRHCDSESLGYIILWVAGGIW